MRGAAHSLPRLERPAVLAHQCDGERASWLLDISAELNCLEGHFHGRPIVAGVVQLAWATGFAGEHFAESRAVLRVDRLKFTRPLLPGVTATLSLRRLEDGARVAFQLADDTHRYSAGHLVYEPSDL